MPTIWKPLAAAQGRLIEETFAKSPPEPAWFQFSDRVENRTTLRVRPGQVAGAHEKFAGDFAAGELEGLFEEFDPVLFGQRVVVVEPLGKRSMRLPQGQDLPGVVDRGIDLEAVANDAGIVQKSFPILAPVAGDLDRKSVV